MRRNKRRLRKQQRRFVEAVEQSRPQIDPQLLLADFESISKKCTARLVRVAMRSLAIISAAEYAGEELNNQLNATDLVFRHDEVQRFARRIARLDTLRIMLKAFRIPEDISQQIINLQISQDFAANRPPIPPLAGGSAPILSQPPRIKNAEKPNPFLASHRRR